MSPRPRMSIIAALAFALGAIPRVAHSLSPGRALLDDICNSAPPATFGMRYGSNPRPYNGGQRSGVAAAKRSARKRRNIRQHPRGSA